MIALSARHALDSATAAAAAARECLSASATTTMVARQSYQKPNWQQRLR